MAEKTFTKENIEHPSHYAEGRKYEPIKVIQDWNLDFALGNTVKYISRAGRKTSAAMSDDEKALEDLKKAKFYLDYKIQELEDRKIYSQTKTAKAIDVIDINTEGQNYYNILW